MKFITDQVVLATNAVKLEKPMIRFTKSYSSSIRLTLNNQVKLDESLTTGCDEMVVQAVRSRARLVLDIANKAYKVKVDGSDIVDTVLYHIEQQIVDFLRYHGGHTNNRLSKIYKWYKEKIHVGSLKTNEKLAQDLFNIAKFIAGNRTEEQTKAARTLLVLIKDRYEPILGSI
jgi:hypothetical protein